jgi:hypothetical protein
MPQQPQPDQQQQQQQAYPRYPPQQQQQQQPPPPPQGFNASFPTTNPQAYPPAPQHIPVAAAAPPQPKAEESLIEL